LVNQKKRNSHFLHFTTAPNCCLGGRSSDVDEAEIELLELLITEQESESPQTPGKLKIINTAVKFLNKKHCARNKNLTISLEST